MDKHLLKLLYGIYWESGKGWKRQPDLPSDSDFQKLVDFGLASNPIEISHDDVLKRYWNLYPKIDLGIIAAKFVASFSKKNLEYRADLMAFSRLPIKIESHKFDGKGFCNCCGVPESNVYDFTKNQFMRYKFGAGCMFYLMNNVLTLESSHSQKIEPTEKDIEIFRSILETIKDLSPEGGSQELKNKLKGLFQSNDDERRNIIELLGDLNILSPSDASNAAYAKVPTRSNWFGQVSVWKARDGINEDNLKMWFGKYLN